ncbi:peptidase M50 [Thioalkalivibrio nitratireducens DSM 14787]|uniref:Peptidase M50 n=1 Tax=Thioalkalivibrio nitratireducens (strain DSM 14787 / UNIQEM 213 / ALEN2) TaxID=1255043 RepID=L0DVT8_THIND|nr:site-2 protease family protein [Thioalkalivibrio nitratireducens]AGA33095.1 peptidase M50 [Thioalkalivibrio nitratireducens DSM 14787]
MESLIQTIAIWTLPVLFAITVHEAAHGYVARALGDTTAAMLGRLTLNPLKHIDPVGTIAVPLGLLTISSLTPGPPFVFGWAKPVPVNTRNLGHPQRDMAVVAVAGPLANLAMAVGWALVIKVGLAVDHAYSLALVYMGMAGIAINVLLMVLNLLPLPPLDGGRVVAGFLPARAASRFERIEPYGLLIVLALLVTGLLGTVIGPLYSFFMDVIGAGVGLPFARM